MSSIDQPEGSISIPSLLTPGKRESGVLLHVTSLPGRYGIGDLGPTAIAWIDRLADARQSWWQFLPVGPPGLGNSPYDPLSTFAGNLNLISPDLLREDRLIESVDVGHHGFDATQVLFDAVKHYKLTLLRAAYETYYQKRAGHLDEAFVEFKSQHQHWVDDFALFMAIKHQQHGEFFYRWPKELARREPVAMAFLRQDLKTEIEYHQFCQFLFYRQWQQLKAHADSRRVRLMGDLPFFVSHDSAEVWANPDLFLLDADRHPTVVAGVPPDYFSKTGQLWGNPVYNWTEMKSRNYQWWTRRLASLLCSVDGVRLDHFRAFCAAWHIPAGAPTAETGEWVEGPGEDFFKVIQDQLSGLPFIAEDLGLITDDVLQLRIDFIMPGMRVLQFAFDGDPNNIFLPEFYDENSVAFTGTHDNDTTRGWYSSLNETGLASVHSMFGPGVNENNITRQMLRTVWESKSLLAIAPLQDLLNLGSEARMNVPGQAAGNWGWRVTDSQLTDDVFGDLSRLTEAAGRG
jgi:4-alpha-glucanotransferase